MSALMSALMSSGGGIKPSGLINGSSGFPFQMVSAGAFSANDGYIKNVTAGAVVSGVLTTILSLSGKGSICFLACKGNDNTSRAHRIKVTLDGVVIFDATSKPVTAASHVGCVIGMVQSETPNVIITEPLLFDTSLLIEYASSVSELDKTVVAYRYYPR